MRFLSFISLALSLLQIPVYATAQSSAVTVVVEKVKLAQISDTTPLIAQLIATVDSDVAARRNGVVDTVLFQVGDTVKKGQELVRMDDQLARIQSQNAEAALLSARTGIAISKARVKLTENAFSRQSGLRGSVAFSKARFEDLQQEAAQAFGELARSEAQVAIAEAALERAKYDREYSVIVAPFDGVIITRNVQPGQYISLGGSVAMLLELSSLEIEADVPVSLLKGLEIGRELGAVLHDGTRVKATVRTMLPIETVSTRTRPVRLSFSLPDVETYMIANGETVTVLVPVGAVKKITIVPKDALVQGLDGGWMVFAAEDGKAIPKSITVGRASQGGMEILTGIAEGDYVVTRGNERLRPNQLINAQDEDGTPITSISPAKSEG